MKHTLLFPLAICAGLAAGGVVIAQDQVAPPVNSAGGSAIGSSPVGSGSIGVWVWSKETDAAVENFVNQAKDAGYSASVAPGEFGTVDVELTKVTKTPETHGILRQRWDLRETWDLKYLPTKEGLKITDADRVVEQKPPIGPWTTTLEEPATVPKNWILLPTNQE